MFFGEGQQSSNKNTEKCRGMYRRGKNRRIKGNPNVYYGEKRRMHGKKRGTSGSERRGRRFKSCRIDSWQGVPEAFKIKGLFFILTGVCIKEIKYPCKPIFLSALRVHCPQE